jgi:hypothetical protein
MTREELEQGYVEMGADREREAEALEWSEAFTGETLESDEFSPERRTALEKAKP